MKNRFIYIWKIDADEKSMCNIENHIEEESFDYKLLCKIKCVK